MEDAKPGTTLIADERARQINDEGYWSRDDDKHTGSQLAIEAGRWALEGTINSSACDGLCGTAEHRRSKSRIRQLVIAGALIAAEIDRLQRAKT